MAPSVVEKTADYITESAQQAARATGYVADAIEDGVKVARRAVRQSGEAAEEFLNDTTKLVKQNPFATVGVTLAVGVLSGFLIGLSVRRR